MATESTEEHGKVTRDKTSMVEVGRDGLLRKIKAIFAMEPSDSKTMSSLHSNIVYEVRPCTSPLRGSCVALRCSNSFQMNLSAVARLRG